MKKSMNSNADSKTHWKQLMNPEFLGAYSLPEGEDLVVTIDLVENREIVGAQGKKEICTVAHLANEKPMILNATNCKTLAKLFGKHIEDWAGQPMTLYATTTKFGGDTVECLRIRAQTPVPVKQAINEERLSKAISKINSGAYTVAKLTALYQLTPTQAQRLSSEVSVTHA